MDQNGCNLHLRSDSDLDSECSIHLEYLNDQGEINPNLILWAYSINLKKNYKHCPCCHDSYLFQGDRGYLCFECNITMYKDKDELEFEHEYENAIWFYFKKTDSDIPPPVPIMPGLLDLLSVYFINPLATLIAEYHQLPYWPFASVHYVFDDYNDFYWISEDGLKDTVTGNGLIKKKNNFFPIF